MVSVGVIRMQPAFAMLENPLDGFWPDGLDYLFVFFELCVFEWFFGDVLVHGFERDQVLVDWFQFFVFKIPVQVSQVLPVEIVGALAFHKLYIVQIENEADCKADPVKIRRGRQAHGQVRGL
jgi:hypothetical protein